MVLFWPLHLSLAPCVGIVKADYWQYFIVSGLCAHHFRHAPRTECPEIEQEEFYDFLKSGHT